MFLFHQSDRNPLCTEITRGSVLRNFSLELVPNAPLNWYKQTKIAARQVVIKTGQNLSHVFWGVNMKKIVNARKKTIFQTNSSQPKMDGWNTIVPFWGWPIFRGHSFVFRVLIRHPIHESQFMGFKPLGLASLRYGVFLLKRHPRSFVEHLSQVKPTGSSFAR